MFPRNSSNRLLYRLVLLSCVAIVGCTNAPKSTTESTTKSPANIRPPAATDRSGTPTEGWCTQLPKVSVARHSPQVRCVGLIDNQLDFPRGVVAFNNDIIVVDKGSNLHQQALGTTQGRILRYTPTPLGFKRSVLLEGLNNPSSLSRGQHAFDRKYLYVSTPNAILRFAPDSATSPIKIERVAEGLPLTGWHYLSAAYATPNYLFVTVPSATDHCEGPTREVVYPCQEVNSTTSKASTTATIRRYSINVDGSVSSEFVLLAHGLRDALAMMLTTDGSQLIVADNSWDDISGVVTEPLDELNLITVEPGMNLQGEQQVEHFGWPYCYQSSASTTAITPGYETHLQNCEGYRNATQVLPAHSAPLALLSSNNRIIANLHGFAAGGRKTMSWPADEHGLPRGTPELLIDWNYQHRRRYLGGRPFGLANYGENAVLVTDDWNSSLMIIYLADPANAEQTNVDQVSGVSKK